MGPGYALNYPRSYYCLNDVENRFQGLPSLEKSSNYGSLEDVGNPFRDLPSLESSFEELQENESLERVGNPFRSMIVINSVETRINSLVVPMFASLRPMSDGSLFLDLADATSRQLVLKKK